MCFNMGNTATKKLVILLLLMTFLNSFKSFATEGVEKDKHLPPPGANSLVLQGYGYSGDIALGIDIPSDSGSFHFITLLGIAQQTRSGKRHGLLTVKSSWHPISPLFIMRSAGQSVFWEPFYTGLSVIMHDCVFSNCDNDRVFYELPDRYPTGYYPQTAINTALNIGSSIVVEKYIIYAEMIMTMQGVDAYYHNHTFLAENYDYWGLEAVASLGIGIKIQY